MTAAAGSRGDTAYVSVELAWNELSFLRDAVVQKNALVKGMSKTQAKLWRGRCDALFNRIYDAQHTRPAADRSLTPRLRLLDCFDVVVIRKAMEHSVWMRPGGEWIEAEISGKLEDLSLALAIATQENKGRQTG